MKKHLLKFFVSLTVVLLFVGFNSQSAFAGTSDDWEYEIKSSEIRIIKYQRDEEVVNVPDIIDGKPVTTIAEGAFENTTGGHNNIDSIYMPSVTYIEDAGIGAFRSCTSLKSINMPNAAYIGKEAFNGCSNLSSVYMPNVTSTGDASFFECTSLTSVDMPKATSVGYQSFFNCSSLKSVNMPNVVTISGDAFKGTGLTSVTVPSSATFIDYGAFSNCSNLQSVTILSDTVTIRDSAFENCHVSMKIYCHAGSNAEAYAKSKGVQCILLSSNPTTPEEHNWVWQTITEPTEYTDGMEGYVCTICGATKDTVTLPSAGVFMKNRYKQIEDAKAGETVVLEMGPWHSLSKGFMEEIAKRRDVTFVIHFIYEGKKYEVVIPAGRPLVLDPSINWYGPLKQNEMFGMKEIR